MLVSTLPLSMDDAVVPGSRSRTPLSLAAIHLSNGGGGGSGGNGLGLGELAMLMESRPVEREARRLGERLSMMITLGGVPVSRVVEALRWIFVDWTVAGIVLCLWVARLPPTLEVRTLVGLTADWEVRHVAELLVLMYFVSPMSLERRQRAWETLKRMPPRRAVSIATHLRLMIALYNNNELSV